MQKRAATEATRKKVMIVDDHPLMRDGLGRLINNQPDLLVCGEASEAPEALSIAKTSHPDLAIVDISLRTSSGLDLIKDLHARYPRLLILALSMHSEDLYAERALSAGARGYIMKSEPADKVLNSLRKVLNGQPAVSEHMIDRLIHITGHGIPVSDHPAVDALSDRELDIFRLLGEGHSTREIATDLHLAVSTVESYRASIKQKLSIRNATELVSRAALFVSSESGG